MKIEYDVTIPMDDGSYLAADVFRPDGDESYPVVLTMGPYAKGRAFQEGYAGRWRQLLELHPEVATATSNRYQNWETVDPELWIPDGYVCVRVDSRGAGRSPGFLDMWSKRETADLAECIEWAGTQSWSNGRVGLCGISYYAMNQWHVAMLKPRHLAAMCVWEGAGDYYRDVCYHGGIFSRFTIDWFEGMVLLTQHGFGKRGSKDPNTGEYVAGPETLADQELRTLRCDPSQELRQRPLDGPYYRERSADFGKIEVPLLSAGNWGGQGLHLRGNVEGYLGARSPQKWLELHCGTHFSKFYSAAGVALQKQFFGYFLKSEDTGWLKRPPVQLEIRHADGSITDRGESEWPIARTEWTRLYLTPTDRALSTEPEPGAAPLSFDALGDGLTFSTSPLKSEVEITGPSVAKLFVSSTTSDCDVFVILRVFDPEGNEVTFYGSNDPHTPMAHGWLRASHRKLDAIRSLPYRPYHPHDEVWPLEPGVTVALDVELWPTCIVVPAGYRIAVTVRGCDYDNGLRERYPEFDDDEPIASGVGPFLHDDEFNRPPETFGGVTTLHSGGDQLSYVELPLVAGTHAAFSVGEDSA